MVVVNTAQSEINAKIVYYGPALSGKTTNLEQIYERMPSHAKGKMVSMKTRTDRTLFFDFLPLELGDMGGYKTRMLLYTVPGQVYYNATRKLVLKGADAVVFVADSGASKMAENVESLRNLEENLNELGLTLDTTVQQA
jgi:signal recognition particle receptor subunit beta